MIKLDGITKSFGRSGDEVLALDDISLTFGDNEFVTVIGPSGCGKTTLLRVIAGLIPQDSGTVEIDGKVVSGPGPERAVVFQSIALMPWATVRQNISFGMEMRGVPKSERADRVNEMLKLVSLEAFGDRYPRQLSGGMQQRVGIARALAVNPQILLMDEPFGALDEQTRRFLQESLLEIWEQKQGTVVFITHSMEEAVLLADRVVLLAPRPGRIAEVIDVDLERPRGLGVEKTKSFVDTKEYLWERLREMTVMK